MIALNESISAQEVQPSIYEIFTSENVLEGFKNSEISNKSEIDSLRGTDHMDNEEKKSIIKVYHEYNDIF